MKTVLLTGATGFLGSHLLEAMVEHGYKVIILKRSGSDLWRISHLIHKIKNYNIDKISINEIFSENTIDVIVHAATLYRKFDDDLVINDMIEANISFPLELLEVGVRNGVKGFINTGTFFEYDCSILPVNEEAKIKPFNLYAKTKLAFETILESYSKQLSINTFRLFSPYGEKDNDKLMPMIIKNALADNRIELSDGLQKLDFIYVGDIVDAYLKSIERIEPGKFGYRVYNLGSGIGVSVREVVSIVEQQLGKIIDKIWGQRSKVDVPAVFADISRARNELFWRPSNDIHEGIAKTIRYYKERDAS